MKDLKLDIQNSEAHLASVKSNIEIANKELQTILLQLPEKKSELSTVSNETEKMRQELVQLRKECVYTEAERAAILATQEHEKKKYDEDIVDKSSTVEKLKSMIETYENHISTLDTTSLEMQNDYDNEVERISNELIAYKAETDKKRRLIQEERDEVQKSLKEVEVYKKESATKIQSIRDEREAEIERQANSLEGLKNGVISVLDAIKDKKVSLDKREESIKEIEFILAKKLR